MTSSRSASRPRKPFDFENPPHLTSEEYARILPLLNEYDESIPEEVALHISRMERTFIKLDSKDFFLICQALLSLWPYSNTGEDERRKVCARIREKISHRYKTVLCDCICTMRKRASVIAAVGGANQLLALKKRFNVPYKNDGQLVYNFVSYLNSLISYGFRTRYFSCSVAIPQSSYSGKSRLMSRIAELLPMAYICCPEKSAVPSYPVQTPIDWEMLVDVPSHPELNQSNSRIFARCISFLNTLALFCASVALKCSKMSEEKAAKYRKKFIAHQYTRMFWETVINKSLQDVWWIYNSLLKGIIYEEASNSMHWQKYDQSISTTILQSFPYHFTDLSMIVCIDNAKFLSDFVPKGSRWDLLTHLNHASRYTPTGFALVILGAIPEIKVVPENPSLENRHVGLEQAVFTDLCVVDPGHIEDCGVASSLAEARSVDFICGFGKPMWNAVRLCNGSWGDVLSVAMAKLINCPNFEEYKSQAVLTNSAIIAIMANRVQFDINPVTTLELDPVQTHMAHLANIDMKNNIATLDYPSDPMLSHAAQYLLMGMDLWVSCLNGLADFILSNIIRKGQRGVLAAQLIICYAIDSILREQIGKTLTTKGAPPQWISLESFLMFFDPKLVENIPKRLEGAAININHFIKASGYVPNRTDLISFISRGAGVVLEDNPSEANLIIPLVLKNPYKNSRVTQESTTFACSKLPDWEDVASTLICRRPLMEKTTRLRLQRLPLELQKLPTDKEMSFTKCRSTKWQANPGKEQNKGVHTYNYRGAIDTSEYVLNPENISYILIKACNTAFKEDRPCNLRDLDPYTAKIDSVENIQYQRPYVALGLHFTEDKVSPDCKAEILSMKIPTKLSSAMLDKKELKNKHVDSSQHIMAFCIVNPHFGFSATNSSDQRSIKDAFDNIVNIRNHSLNDLKKDEKQHVSIYCKMRILALRYSCKAKRITQSSKK